MNNTFKTSITYYEKLEKADEMKDIYLSAEDALNKPLGTVLENGWTVMKKSKPEGYFNSTVKSNFKAVYLQKDGKNVICFFGTDVKNINDLATDVQMVMKMKPRQFKDAENFVKDVLKEYPQIKPENIDYVSHSEGCAEAVHVKGTIGGGETYNYNPYIQDTSKYDQEKLKNIYNIRTKYDIISKMGHSVGEDIIVPINENVQIRNGVYKYIDYHRIQNFGDIKKGLPVEEYQKINPDFKNKFRKGMLKSYEVADIPKELYPLADPDVSDRLSKGKVINAERPKHAKKDEEGSSFVSEVNCAGTYHVSGYTRHDGIEVSDYFRTCGAAHRGKNPYKNISNPSKSSKKGYVPDKTLDEIEKEASVKNKEFIRKLINAAILFGW